MGVEPRSEFFELTILSIVQQIKSFLGIVAWSIERHDAVTSECVQRLLEVLRDEERQYSRKEL
jgi:nicotinamide mononucleotide (NMN) deamidase PncC